MTIKVKIPKTIIREGEILEDCFIKRKTTIIIKGNGK
jgi:hypothetical protein